MSKEVEVTVIVKRPYTAYVEVPDDATDEDVERKLREDIAEHGSAMLYDDGYTGIDPDEDILEVYIY